ncbi:MULTISPECIES: hypoxanthine phosphoribosyltransferase [Helcobacillus]|uniref:Hypoxanthine phosphoribosyltransferase n=1 Tax=Helcobacillus massiliensis TaxID=521392 RepID=A0A839QQR9_9MICO|nr:hypoxanthine phosphoribosyltransferase [Helcobacillus massiliensis]MCG7426402.1 hypoxanthine phosphoribosyltransferase [Helcobacillus sp. ACRRO]
MTSQDHHPDVQSILLTEQQIADRVAELGREIAEAYQDEPPLLVGVLKGAVMIVADLARRIDLPIDMDWMAVSSYGSGTKSSGVVRIIKDLNADITGRRVLIVEDIIDSGLTLSWLIANLRSRGPKSVEICTLLRKPDAVKVDIDVRFCGFDIPNEFVVGYGLDHAEQYRNLPYIGVLKPSAYTD